MYSLAFIAVLLAIVAAVLAVKVHMLKKAADENRKGIGGGALFRYQSAHKDIIR